MSFFYLFLPFLFIVLVIIFQPEIRHSLKPLRRSKLFSIALTPGDLNPEKLAKDISQIVIAIKELSNDKYGALIVIEPPESEHDYLSPGTEINGDISSNLLLTIFTPRSPLHDGATIIQKDKIKAAGVILSITDNYQLSHIYGTRHRAALGLTENFDCLCIIVSEETGSISVAHHGNLLPCKQTEEITDYLTQFYGQSQITISTTNSESNDKYFNRANISHLAPNSSNDENLAQAADA